MSSGLTGYVRYSKLEEYVTLKSFLEYKNSTVRHEDFETVKKNVEKLMTLMSELKESIENKVVLNKKAIQNNDHSTVEKEIKLLKEEKVENNKKIELIDSKLAKLNFEQKELKESIDENWELTDKNRDKHEKADEQLKSVKATVSEYQSSQLTTNNNLKVLEEKIATVAKTKEQSHKLPIEDARHVKCENCDVVLANKRQLIQHKKTMHFKKIVCRICEQSFEESFKLEEHLISEHKKNKSYKCMQCECAFVLKWRHKKHIEGHRSGFKVKTCHYYNNNKICPYEFVGCMFKHTEAKECPNSSRCSNTKCQFRHGYHDDMKMDENVHSDGRDEIFLGL